MPLVSVAGRQVYYAHRQPVPANQPPVVLVHGAGGTHQHWLYQVRDLPRSPTFAPDLPGHGRSNGLGHDTIQALEAMLPGPASDLKKLLGIIDESGYDSAFRHCYPS